MHVGVPRRYEDLQGSGRLLLSQLNRGAERVGQLGIHQRHRVLHASRLVLAQVRLNQRDLLVEVWWCKSYARLLQDRLLSGNVLRIRIWATHVFALFEFVECDLPMRQPLIQKLLINIQVALPVKACVEDVISCLRLLQWLFKYVLRHGLEMFIQSAWLDEASVISPTACPRRKNQALLTLCIRILISDLVVKFEWVVEIIETLRYIWIRLWFLHLLSDANMMLFWFFTYQFRWKAIYPSAMLILPNSIMRWRNYFQVHFARFYII